MMSQSNPSQDTYAYEEAEERRAMMRGLHMPMKQWFNSGRCDGIKEKFGSFPMFWQDLEVWEHFRAVSRLYMYLSDRGEVQESTHISTLEATVARQSKQPSEWHISSSASTSSTSETHDETPASVAGGAGVGGGEEDEKRKRRRNRWGDAPPAPSPSAPDTAATEGAPHLAGNTAADSSGQHNTTAAKASDAAILVDVAAEDPSAKRRRSRWSEAPQPAAPPAPAVAITMTPEMVQQTLVLQMQLKQVTDRLASVVQDALQREQDPDRSPSPPPRYDGSGKRTNTREIRMREALNSERSRIIENLIKINPLYQPPSDFVRSKPVRKLYIPFKEHPNYNFIGLIIGPRGNTQKRLEKETNTKISIRGKGSVKEGSKNRVGKAGAAGGPTASADDDDDLHVHIQGETEESVEAAAKLVQELLVPVEDDKNEHKQKQLRELALINGTLREDEFCQVCGERGHKHFECPHRSKTFKAANVKCAICGDQSHPTRDCPLKESGPTNEIALDNEYDSFIAELGGGGGGGPAARPAQTAEQGAVSSSSNNEYSDSATIATTSDGVTSVTERFLGNKKQTIIESKVVLTGWGVQPSASAGMGAGMGAGMAAGMGGAPGAVYGDGSLHMDPAAMAAYQAYQQQYYAYYGCYYDPQLMYSSGGGGGYTAGGAEAVCPPPPPVAPPPPPPAH